MKTDNTAGRSGASLSVLAFALCAAGLTIAPQAAAQQAAGDAQAAPAENPGAVDKVVITGSRIQKDGFDAPTPVTVLDNEIVESLAQVNISETIKMLPQNYSSQSDASAGYGTSPNVGSAFANLRGLNGSGTRTLTLVNTRRFVPSSDNGAVDLNMVPSALISRVETVTGGASAAYGSDAVAGVVNIILDTDFEGIKAELDYGQTFENDGESYHASLAWGSSFSEGRGRLIASVEYQDQKGIGDCSAVRDWCAESWDIFRNESTIGPNGTVSGYNVPGSPGYGQPNLIVGPNSKIAFNDKYGVVRDRAPAAAAARNWRFTADGKGIVKFDPGLYVSTTTFMARQGGDGESTFADSDLRTPFERKIAFLYGSYDLSDDWSVDAELTFGQRTASSVAGTTGPRSTMFVKPTNAYLPAQLVTLLAGTQFSPGKDLEADIVNLNKAEANVMRGAFGVQGDIFNDWHLNAYYQYGKNERNQIATRSRVNTPFIYALDAVVNPATGQIVCAETLKANPDPVSRGCAPMNLWGLGNISQAAIDYAYRPVQEDFTFTQHVLSANVSGALLDYWAGSLDAAVGVDYRYEEGEVSHGNIPNYNDYAFTFGLDYAGNIEVLETFLEVNAPVIRDAPMAKLLEVNGAVRWTRNTSSDTVRNLSKTIDATSWKVSGIYDMFDGVRFRATQSRDIRVAGFRDLFLNNIPSEPGTAQGRVDNPNIPGSPAGGDDDTPILGGGSFALGAEKALTTTIGSVFTPWFAPQLQISADWYEIEIEDAVSSLSGQGIVDACFRDGAFCDRITFASPTNITFVEATLVNLGQFEARGVDIEIAYNMALADMFANAPGDLSLRALGTYQYDFIVRSSPGGQAIDYAGQSGDERDLGGFTAAPEWIWNGFLTYSTEPFRATLQMTHIGEGQLNVKYIGPDDSRYAPTLPNSINDNTVKSATYFTLSMSYKTPLAGTNGEIEYFGVINNLFDKDPPIAPGGGGVNLGSFYPTNPTHFDTFGARFKAGVRLRF